VNKFSHSNLKIYLRYLFFVSLFFFFLFDVFLHLNLNKKLFTMMLIKSNNSLESKVKEIKDQTNLIKKSDAYLNWQTYKNNNLGLSLNYPSNWRSKARADSSDVSFYKEKEILESSGKKFSIEAIVEVLKIDNPQNLTTEQFFEEEQKKCVEAGGNNEFSMGCDKTYVLSEWESKIIDGIFSTRAKIKGAGSPIETDEIYFYFDNYFLVLRAIPEEQNYKYELEKVFDKIIDSIHFI
jgi:hypothetical protein